MFRNLVLVAVVVAVLDLTTTFAVKWLAPDLAEEIGLVRSETRARTAPPFDFATYSYAPLFEGSITWGSYTDQPFLTNSLGFKDAELRDVQLSPEAHRVLLIGDSFTEGVGVPYEDTFSGVLAEKYRSIEFLNGAVQGRSPKFYREKVEYLWRDLGLRFDEVVVPIDVSDIPNASNQSGCISFRGNELGRPAKPTIQPPVAAPTAGPTAAPLPDTDSMVNTAAPAGGPADANGIAAGPVGEELADGQRRTAFAKFKTALKSHSMIALFADRVKDSLLERPDDSVLHNVNWSLSLWTIDDAIWVACAKTGVESARRHMTALHRFLEEQGVKLTVAVYPWPDQLFFNDRSSRHLEIWRTWAAEHSVEFVDLFPAFFDYAEAKETIRALYLVGDVHFNAAGHRLVADRLGRLWADRRSD